MKSTSKETAAFLWEELEKYEEVTEMTEEERSALHEWVFDGNSVHENASMSYNENGAPTDFLDDYRYMEEIRLELEKLTPEEREEYLARLRGEDTLASLSEALSECHFKMEVYYNVLQRHGLAQEAEAAVKRAKESSDRLSQWIHDMEFEEQPFG